MWSTAPANAGQFAYWTLDPPGDTTITNLSYAGMFSAWGGWTAQWVAYFGPNRNANLADVGGGDDCAVTSCSTGTVLATGGSTSVAISGATRIGVGVFCHAAAGYPANNSQSLFGPAGSINVWKATLTIDEPSAPVMSAIGGSVYGADSTGWISDRNAPAGPGWTANGQASDPGGVCALNLSLGGLSTSNDVIPNFGSTTPCQTGTQSATVNLNPCQPGGLGPGSYSASASASNPAAMVSYASGGTFNVECSGPSVSVLSTEVLGRWYPGPQTVSVNASDPSGLQGPVSCSVGRQPAVSIQPSQLPYALRVTPGRLERCGLQRGEQCQLHDEPDSTAR